MLTYSEVGATAGELPKGYHHLRMSRMVGQGADDFRRAVEAVMTWRMHTGAGLTFVDGPARAALGADVVLRWLGQRIPCRVVRVVDEPRRAGFAYGSLPGHPERGEESFVVTHDAQTDDVWCEIVAFSVPGRWTTRALGPLGRVVQRLMTRRYLDAVARAASAPPRGGLRTGLG